MSCSPLSVFLCAPQVSKSRQLEVRMNLQKKLNFASAMPKLKAHSRRQVPQDSAKATYQTMSVGDAIVLRGKRKVAAALLKDSRVDELVRERGNAPFPTKPPHQRNTTNGLRKALGAYHSTTLRSATTYTCFSSELKHDQLFYLLPTSPTIPSFLLIGNRLLASRTVVIVGSSRCTNYSTKTLTASWR